MNRKNIGKKTLVAYGVSAPALILISSIVVSPSPSVHINILNPSSHIFKRLFMVQYSLNGTNYISYRKKILNKLVESKRK